MLRYLIEIGIVEREGGHGVQEPQRAGSQEEEVVCVSEPGGGEWCSPPRSHAALSYRRYSPSPVGLRPPAIVLPQSFPNQARCDPPASATFRAQCGGGRRVEERSRVRNLCFHRRQRDAHGGWAGIVFLFEGVPGQVPGGVKPGGRKPGDSKPGDRRNVSRFCGRALTRWREMPEFRPRTLPGVPTLEKPENVPSVPGFPPGFPCPRVSPAPGFLPAGCAVGAIRGSVTLPEENRKTFRLSPGFVPEFCSPAHR